MTWKRTVTGIAAVVALAATAFVVSASDPTSSEANVYLGPSLPPLPSGPVTPKPFIDIGTGATSGVLVIASGQALYYNDQDVSTSIACVGDCAKVWHPLTRPAGVPLTLGPAVIGVMSTVQRADGTTQITYNGHPLYTFTVDGQGHLTGDGTLDSFFGKAFSWHAATASGQPLNPSVAPSLPVPGLTPTPNPTGPTSPVPTGPTPTPTSTPTTPPPVVTNPTHAA
jgi:predicted lipoprotein with Yx(FWY)xxD motif